MQPVSHLLLGTPGQFPKVRPRRLRQSQKVRHLVRKHSIDIAKLVMPIFIKHGTNIKAPIKSMPGMYQISIDRLAEEIKEIVDAGIKAVILFGIPANKDAEGSDASSDDGIIQRAIPVIKQLAPSLLIISDVCFCEYTDHGHCGVIHTNDAAVTDVHNDKTLELLAKQAVSHAKAGADVLAPSGNMDGMVQAIRTALDAAGYEALPILSYSVKYASALYGPFREAAEGAPKFGDRHTYQMDFAASADDAIRECGLDIAEGADMLMVKPAHAYLDIIYRIKQRYPTLPLAAYHTSAEFAMIKAAAEKGWIDESKVVHEVLTAIHRAGADFIITYYAKQVAQGF